MKGTRRPQHLSPLALLVQMFTPDCHLGQGESSRGWRS